MTKPKGPPYIEVPNIRNGYLVGIGYRLATQEEINIGRIAWCNNQCEHELFYDIAGYIYDYRQCYFCDKCKGLI